MIPFPVSSLCAPPCGSLLFSVRPAAASQRRRAQHHREQRAHVCVCVRGAHSRNPAHGRAYTPARSCDRVVVAFTRTRTWNRACVSVRFAIPLSVCVCVYYSVVRSTRATRRDTSAKRSALARARAHRDNLPRQNQNTHNHKKKHLTERRHPCGVACVCVYV